MTNATDDASEVGATAADCVLQVSLGLLAAGSILSVVSHPAFASTVQVRAVLPTYLAYAARV
jgi:hypothetical protein